MLFTKSTVAVICAISLMGCSGTPAPTPGQGYPTPIPEPTIDPNDARRQTILSELARLDSRQFELSQNIFDRQDNLSDLKTQLDSLESDITSHDGIVTSFISDNVMASGCISAADISLNEDNQYSQDTKDLADVTSAVCLVALLNGDFRNRVIDAADWLNQADIHGKNLDRQADGMRLKIEEEAKTLESFNARAEETDRRIQSLQYEINELDDL